MNNILIINANIVNEGEIYLGCVLINGNIIAEVAREIENIYSAVEKLEGKISSSCMIGYGNYYNKKRFYGDMFILKNDSTFIYTHLNKTKDNIEYFDSSSGNFKLVGDTLYLSYLYIIYSL